MERLIPVKPGAAVHKVRLSRTIENLKPDEEVQVVLLDWRQGIEKRNIYLQWFGDIERRMCENKKTGILRLEYICSHGLLREALGVILRRSPDSFSFAQNQYGKLHLSCESICFNLSHSEELLAFAFSLRRDLGVDVECVKKIPGLKDIANNLFSPHENQMLDLCRSRQSFEKSFYKIWTVKEALVKCVGTGFACEVTEMDTFDSTVSIPACRKVFFKTTFKNHSFDVFVNECREPYCILTVAVQGQSLGARRE